MKEHPILFSGPMVRAILEGRKTQTRRVMKWKRGTIERMLDSGKTICWEGGSGPCDQFCPYGIPGDRLWVRESIAVNAMNYAATKTGEITPDSLSAWHLADGPKRSWCDKTLTARFMPRWASRITLEITDVRVQRLQEISHNDALAEGVEYDVSEPDGAPLPRFRTLWNSINAKRGFGWDANPWVWALTFKAVR